MKLPTIFLAAAIVCLLPPLQAKAFQESHQAPIQPDWTFVDPAVEGPIYAQPICSDPIYSQPNYSEPIHSQPIISQPIILEPMISQPVYVVPGEPGVIDQPVGPNEDQGGVVQFTGRVVFKSFEGGFYGILADNGQRYSGAIPAGLKQEGTRVKGSLRVRSQMTTTLWGTSAEFLEISSE